MSELLSLKKDITEHKFCIASVACIAASIVLAQLLLLISPAVGAVATVAVLGGLAITAMRCKRIRMAALAASLIPAATMASLAMPQAQAIHQAAVFYVILFLLTVSYSGKNIPLKKKGKRQGTWRSLTAWLAIAAGAGVLIGLAGFFVTGQIPPPATTTPWLLLAGVTSFAIIEELYFRHFLQRQTRREVGPALAAFLSVALYASITLPMGAAGVTLVALASNSIFAYIYYRQQNLVYTLAANMASKLTFALLYFA